MTEIKSAPETDFQNQKQGINSDNENDLGNAQPFAELAQKYTKLKKSKEKRFNEKTEEILICTICGEQTTYGDFPAHKKTEKHQSCQKKDRKEKRKQSRASGKAAKALPDAVSPHNARIVVKKKTQIREKYTVRPGDPLPEHHQMYINTLAVFLALRYTLNSEMNFKISIFSSKWNEFGDIVIELENNRSDVTEVQAIQCKQIRFKETIQLEYLGAEQGKFSLKGRYEILKKLLDKDKPQKKSYGKSFFKLYTVSNLALNRDTFSSFGYDNDIVQTWNEKQKELWKNREFTLSKNKKVNFLNTTDEPDDIYNFKIVNHEDQDLYKILSRFSMFTNQKKLGALKSLIASILQNKFDRSRNISSDIIKSVSDYFSSNVRNDACFKLTKRDFLLKVAKLLLEPYVVLPEAVTEGSELELWNHTILEFDLTVVKNYPDMITKIFSGIDYRLKQETDYVLNGYGSSLKIENGKIDNSCLKMELFGDFNNATRDISLPNLYLAMWKTKLVPLVLQADEDDDLSLINQVLDFVKDQSLDVKFIILTSNSKIDGDTFSKHLDIFLAVEDLKLKNIYLLESILKTIQIQFLDFPVALEDIVKCNKNFLKKVTPDALLNMCSGDYSFQETDIPMTRDIIENTLVLKDDDIRRISNCFNEEDSETEADCLSYIVAVKGKLTEIHVPPEL